MEHWLPETPLLDFFLRCCLLWQWIFSRRLESPCQQLARGKSNIQSCWAPVVWASPQLIRLMSSAGTATYVVWFQFNPFHLYDWNLQDTSYSWYISLSKPQLGLDHQLLDTWAPTVLTCAHRGPYWNVWHAAYIFSRKKVKVLFLPLNCQSGSCKGPIKLVLTNYSEVKAVTSSRSLSFIAARFYTKTVILV